MRIMHIGLACSNEQDADRFYRDLLGLDKQERKMIPVSITKPLFGLHLPLPVVNYTGAGLHVEVFLLNRPGEFTDSLSHVCLEVEDAGALLHRAESMGITVTRAPKGNEGWVLFIEDSDGHRFEVKERVTRS